MIKIYVYSCLLSALSIVEMKPLNIKGRVGENVTITFSDWNSWTDVKSNVKYFCNSPCSEDKHIIIKVAFKKTERKNRIELTNSADGLFVTFINLQKSDSGKYYCGAERFGPDRLIEVNLQVTDAESPSPKTTPKPVSVTNSIFTASSTSSDIITDMSTPFNIHPTTTTTTIASAAKGAVMANEQGTAYYQIDNRGSIPYLIIGVTVIITTLVVLLMLLRKMMKKQLKVEGADEDGREDTEYHEIRPVNQQTGSQTTDFSTVGYSADPDGLYANYCYHQDTELAAENGNNHSKDFSLTSASSSGINPSEPCAESRVTDPQSDVVYSVAQLPKEQIEPTGQRGPNQFEIYENDSLYSLVQIPQAT